MNSSFQLPFTVLSKRSSTLKYGMNNSSIFVISGLLVTDILNICIYVFSWNHFIVGKEPLAYLVFNRWHTSLWFKMKLFSYWLRCKNFYSENRSLNLVDKPLKVGPSEAKKIFFCQIDWNVIKTILSYKKAFL